jgi:hypothetical protein
MKTGALKRTLGLILLYCGIFVLIVLVQFSGNPGLSQKIGAFSMSAAYPKANHGRPAAGTAPESVRLSYAGLVFEISPKSPAESLAADGTAIPLALLSAAKLPSGASVKLSSGVEIRASVRGPSADSFSLAATAPDGIVAVRLRLASSKGLGFSASGDKRTMSSSGKVYDFALGAAAFDQVSGLLTLKPGDAGFSLAWIEPAKPANPAPASPGPAKLAAQAPKDADAFKSEIAAWRDKVWTGLSIARYDADKLAWKGPDGVSAFSEKSLAAYLAEAAFRGSYADAITRARGVKEKWSDKLGFLTAPYLGSLYGKMNASDAADQIEIKRLTQLVADKSPTLLEKEGLLCFLVDRAPSSLSRDAIAYIVGVDQSKLSARQAVGLLSCAVDSKSLFKDESNPFSASATSAAVADRIAASVRKTSSGSFFVDGEGADGGSDVRLSLLAGEVLVAYGQASSKPNLVGLGQSLVEGVMAISDAQGFVPSRVVATKEGSVDQKAGSILPEDLYSILADNPYYPHEVSFARDAGSGVWAWTCAPSLSMQTSASRKVFSAGFFVGRAHYLAIYGIKRFANIQLYDIDYSPDNDFESYDASGYRHDIDKGVLYLKMKHKKDVEDIKLSF